MPGAPRLLAAAVVVAVSGAASAADYGTAEEARAMLERAAAALQADRNAALAAFTAGEEGFKDRDLYVFCVDPDTGVLSAHGASAALVGQPVPELRNRAGERVEDRIVAVAIEGGIGEVEYLWPRPGESEPVDKVSYVTRVDDQVCGVGYYE
jgi:signal transduction histidine kinase